MVRIKVIKRRVKRDGRVVGHCGVYELGTPKQKPHCKEKKTTLPCIHFMREITRSMSWPHKVHYFSGLQSIVVFPRIHLLSTHSFFGLEAICLTYIFDFQLPAEFTEKLVFPRYANCVLSRLHHNDHSLPSNSHPSRIVRIENPSCSACGYPNQLGFLSSHSSLSCCELFGSLVLEDSLFTSTSGSDRGQ